MKCPKCGRDNGRAAKFCAECGTALAPAATAPVKPAGPREKQEPVNFWTPDWRWHLKALAAIYAILIVVFFVVSVFLSKVPKPYRMRDIPPEMTPWLKQ